MSHNFILPVVFVTDRLMYQVTEDYEHGLRYRWSKWRPNGKWFVSQFRELQPLRPPNLSDGLARELVKNNETLYRLAYASGSEDLVEPILEHWRRTPTRTIRLLVRLTVNELDLRRGP